MPLSQIAVEIVVPDAPTRGNSQKKNPVESPELRRALLQACSDTVQVAVCVNADSARHAAALALVFWKGTGRVRIEVGSKEAPGGQTWTSREIDFSPRDAPIERWRAAGYAAGTLASLLVRGDRSASHGATTTTSGTVPSDESSATREAEAGAPGETGPASAPSEATKAQPETATPPATAAETKSSPEETHEADRTSSSSPERTKARSWRWSFDAAGVVGAGISGSVLRIGGLARVSRAFGGPFVTASAGYAVERSPPEGFSARWFSPSVGVGYVLSLGDSVTLEARLEFLAELLEGLAEDSSTGEQSAAARWLAGGRGGVGLAWAPFDSVSLLVGGAVAARGPETDVFVRDRLRATTPILTYQAEGGLRFTLK